MTETLPIFPLTNVLFPFGRMTLRIFEARYMDLVAGCMRENKHFGICLIKEGQEVGGPAIPHLVGVEARVVDWDMSQPGLLGITVRGGRRFRIHDSAPNEQDLVIAQIEWLNEPANIPLEEGDSALLPLLKAVAADTDKQVIAPPYLFDDPTWIGYRYAEILPIPALARQRLLELDDSRLRLSIIREFLSDQGLLEKDD